VEMLAEDKENEDKLTVGRGDQQYKHLKFWDSRTVYHPFPGTW
jgi:hypothetical protein